MEMPALITCLSQPVEVAVEGMGEAGFNMPFYNVN